MKQEEKHREYRNNMLTALGFAVWLVGITLWIYLDAFAGSYWPSDNGPVWVPSGNYGVVKSILRILILVPLCTELGIWAVNKWDQRTPGGSFWSILTDEEYSLGTKLAVGLVLAAIIYGVFWLAIQG